MHKRNLYIEKIKKHIDKPVVKVITGLRRVGKSYFLQMLANELRKNGIKDSQIIYINMESLDFDFTQNYQQLNSYIKDKSKGNDGQLYLFIDEVQEVKEWEKCIRSLLDTGEFDIFITGSNAQMLSSELATLLSGRYVEFPIYSLSFNEFLDFMGLKDKDPHQQFPIYLKFGGFPALPHFDLDQEVVYQYISSLYNTILLKDVVKI